ncbi:MAG: class I SAM-dependent RNA methyltransferase [Hyphomonas sp.]|nr:class I SAM-dependent RNA methyltransferase [Hyphomonas sp.]
MTDSDAHKTGETVTIERLGSKGEGQVQIDGRWVSVPLALPGETVRIAREGDRGRLVELVAPSTDRAEPPCLHYGTCGGCSLQHLKEAPYRAFKRNLVVQALKSRGLSAHVEETWITPPGSRRRITLAARMTKQGVRLGFHRRRSDDIVDISECPVAMPDIARKLSALRELAAPLAPLKGEMEILVTAAPNGLDLHMSGTATFAAPHDVMMAGAKALAAGFIRVSIGHEVPLSQTQPEIQVGRAFLRPPPGGFLQASAEAETFMASLVRQHLKFCLEVVDLFAGSGTFALRLAEESRVHAVEGNIDAINALDQSAQAAQGLKQVTCEARDLFRDPVPAATLSKFGGVVIDPPRAGATKQIDELARSGVRRIAYVSCDPGTLARDLRVLADAGYRMVHVQPVDQFLWSTHVETVALLERGTGA